MRRTKILMTVLLLERARLGRGAGGPPDGEHARDLQRICAGEERHRRRVGHA